MPLATEPYVHPVAQSLAQESHWRSYWFMVMVSARHSLQHASKELRGHNLLRTDCNLVLLSWTSGTADCVQALKATCAWIWQFTLGGIWCTNKRHAIWCCLSRAWHCCGWYAAMTYLYGYDSSGLGDIGCTGFSSCCKTAAPWTWRQPHSFLRRTTDV